jgi:GT2 family glycosyltransferase/glycosyltransferase involved in cell wall biosynthesis
MGDSPNAEPELEQLIQKIADRQRRTADGIEAFRRRCTEDRQSRRRLRAWQLMLLVSKSYAMLVGGGWKQRIAWVKWMLQAPFAGFTGLAEFEPQIPEVLNHLPPDYASPLDLEPLRNGAPHLQAGRLGDAKTYDIIILPVFEFDFRYQRPQQLARRFADAGHRVFWISHSRRSAGAAYEMVALSDNLWEIRLACAIPNIYLGTLTSADVKAIIRDLRSLFQDEGLAANCTILQLPFWRQLGLALRHEWGSRLVYDCMDNWDSFPDVSEFLRGEESALSAEADVLVVSARELFEKQKSRGLAPTLVRNAADFEFFRDGRPRDLLAGIPRPRIGYYGAIADWFDYELVRTAAQARPGYSFVLIGGYGLEEQLGDHAARLKDLPNIHLLGHKPYPMLPAYLAEFDVCIIPFLRNRVTDATDPVKLYEYLSQGKPVVSAELSELKQHAGQLYLAANSGDFVKSIDQALHESPALRQGRIEYARRHSWQARQQDLDRAITASFGLVSIIVVTHQSAHVISACLDSLRRHATYPRVEIVCVDNASTDGTDALLRRHAAADRRIRVLPQSRNLGFAVANNLAVRDAAGEWLVLLNADTVVTAGWLERLLRHLQADEKLGMINPVTNSAGNEVMIPCLYRNLQEMDAFAAQLSRERRGREFPLAVCPLFCAMLPRRVWSQTGELDESYVRGMFEDDDYSLRLRAAGYRLAAAEDCFVHHFGGASFGALSREEYDRVFRANLECFEKKWKQPWQAHRYRPGVSEPNRPYLPLDFV